MLEFRPVRATAAVGLLASISLCSSLLTSCTTDESTANPEAVESTVQAAKAGEYLATIRRTTDGVPHILAADFESAIFGQGWASGEDHFCTLADQMLKVTSTRAKFLGPGKDNANIDSDFAWKSIGIEAIARADWPKESDRAHRFLTAFTDGWNGYLNKTGVENLTGFCKGAPWVRPISAEDLYVYGRSVPLLASSGALTGYLGKAQPPATALPTATPARLTTTPTTTPTTAEGEPEALLGSNAWAIGSERTENGGGMLLANPHFPWEGPQKFWEVHLQVPGELDIYGGQLVGLPGIGIGFNEDIAWTHTVSAGKRFTAYKLALDPSNATGYVVDGVTELLDASPSSIEVLGEDGTLTTVDRTLWSSAYGPILDFPGVGWTESTVLALRDANLTNGEFIEQYIDMAQAGSMKELQAAHEKNQGVPLFNTIATDKEGNTWYADTAATPNLSKESLTALADRISNDPITKTAYENNAILLDGSTSRDDWVVEPGSRDPGLVPYSKMPMLERKDYVFNANDSFWLANADALIEGDFSLLHGEQKTKRSPRTQENAILLSDTEATGPSGDDSKFSLEELQDAALRNGGYLARDWQAEVAERCSGSSLVEVPELLAKDGSVALPADNVDVSGACEVIAQWDGLSNLESKGVAVWREFTQQLKTEPLRPFDPSDPVNTPSGIAAPPTDGTIDPVLVALARATQIVTKAGFALDTPLGDIQVDGRGSKLPVPGGTGGEGITNVVGYSGRVAASDPDAPVRPEPVLAGSGLTTEGYWINSGSSLILAVSFDPKRGPTAQSILTYGETGDRESDHFTSQLERFGAKKWKPVAFTAAQIVDEAIGRPYEVSGAITK